MSTRKTYNSRFVRAREGYYLSLTDWVKLIIVADRGKKVNEEICSSSIGKLLLIARSIIMTAQGYVRIMAIFLLGLSSTMDAIVDERLLNVTLPSVCLFTALSDR